MTGKKLPWLVVCAMAVGMMGATAQPVLAAFEPSVFASRERARAVRGTHPFRQWARVIDSHLQHLEAQGCAAGNCALGEWLEELRGLRDRPLKEQLDTVNRMLNSHDYLTDLRNWGIEDYWATPLEFLRRNGDCEDYSIAKFMSLRYLGIDNDRMRIVVVNDENLGIGHAVLVVFDGEVAYVLDNQTSQVVEDRRIRHYAPLYSVNETGWWLHTR